MKIEVNKNELERALIALGKLIGSVRNFAHICF